MIIIQDFLPLCMVFSQIQNGDIEIAFHIMFFVYGIKKHIRHIMRGSRFLPGLGGGGDGYLNSQGRSDAYFQHFYNVNLIYLNFLAGGGGCPSGPLPHPTLPLDPRMHMIYFESKNLLYQTV